MNRFLFLVIEIKDELLSINDMSVRYSLVAFQNEMRIDNQSIFEQVTVYFCNLDMPSEFLFKPMEENDFLDVSLPLSLSLSKKKTETFLFLSLPL